MSGKCHIRNGLWVGLVLLMSSVAASAMPAPARLPRPMSVCPTIAITWLMPQPAITASRSATGAARDGNIGSTTK